MRISHAAILAALIGSWVAPRALGDVIAQWNFNSGDPDGNTSTGSTDPSIGTGTLGLIGGVTDTFYTGDGSSDPTGTDDSGLSLSTFAAQETGDGERGLVVSVSTEGWSSIVVSWDQRNSNTASRYSRFDYTTDGSTWTEIDLDPITAGGEWTNGITVDLSAISEASDCAMFAFRIVAVFAPDADGYVATNSGSNYGTSGTWRFDMLTISGTAIPQTGGEPVPDTAAGVLPIALAGLGLVGWLRRRTPGRS